MKICSVWTAGDFNAKNCLGYHFSKSIVKFGYKIDQRNPALLPICSLPPGDLVISNGFRSHISPIAERMKKEKGADTIVYDLGYIHRSSNDNFKGYYQLGLNRIGWVPSFECPSDRFDNLNVEIKPTVDNGANVVLICAQKFNDAQHKMNEEQMIGLMTDLCKSYSKEGYHVIFRSHPKSPFEIEGTETSEKTLQEEMDRCRFMVTYNSTSGIEAILNGTPVVCLDPNAHYASLSTLVEVDYLAMPSEEDVKQYMHRLAYAQWTLAEVAEGYPLNFLLKVIADQDPFDGTNYTECQHPIKVELPKKIELNGLPWKEARSYVRDITGTWAKNKEHLQQIVDEYNEKD